jgi:hypothetical protein
VVSKQTDLCQVYLGPDLDHGIQELVDELQDLTKVEHNNHARTKEQYLVLLHLASVLGIVEGKVDCSSRVNNRAQSVPRLFWLTLDLLILEAAEQKPDSGHEQVKVDLLACLLLQKTTVQRISNICARRDTYHMRVQAVQEHGAVNQNLRLLMVLVLEHAQ